MRALLRLASASRSLASATRISGLLRRAVASISSRLPEAGFVAFFGASVFGASFFGGVDLGGDVAPGFGWAHAPPETRPASSTKTLILTLCIFFLLLAVEFQCHRKPIVVVGVDLLRLRRICIQSVAIAA